MREIEINTRKSYKVFIERGILDFCGAYVRSVCVGRRAVLVCGDTVAALYAARAEQSLRDAGFDVFRFVYSGGERSKNGETFLALLNFMAENGLDRGDIAIALGGGVTGDLCGFAAACYMRGIACAMIPTTLLSMVDSCIGGKTAIDLDSGKNLAGVFCQPSLVLCDPDLLGTLPEQEIRCGCAEAVKYAMLCEPDILPLLCDLTANAEELIFRCLTVKKSYVEADEQDCGVRRFLNLGHTLAHAVEKRSGYAIGHGQAVGMGLAMITNAAEANGDCERGTYEKLIKVLSELGLSAASPYGADELCKPIMSDKKRNSVNITLVVPRRFGECELKVLPLNKLRDYLFGGEA